MSSSYNISSIQKHLVVEISKDVFEMLHTSTTIKTSLHKPSVDVSTLILEVGQSRQDTPETLLSYFDDNFSGLIEQAFEEQCELIYFYY